MRGRGASALRSSRDDVHAMGEEAARVTPGGEDARRAHARARVRAVRADAMRAARPPGRASANPEEARARRCETRGCTRTRTLCGGACWRCCSERRNEGGRGGVEWGGAVVAVVVVAAGGRGAGRARGGVGEMFADASRGVVAGGRAEGIGGLWGAQARFAEGRTGGRGLAESEI